MGHEYVKESETFNVNRNGTVPKPTAQDISDGKVLKADGTWGSGGGGGTGDVADVLVNGTSVVDENHNAQIVSYKEVTQAEYNALPASKETDGILYCIKDVGGADGFPPLIYSDEEREIGVWRDGKPLYEKTYILNSLSVASDTWVDTGISIGDIDAFVDAFVLDTNTSHKQRFVCLGVGIIGGTSGNIGIYCNFNSSPRTMSSLTIRYTKTTDVAGSGTWTTQGALAHHYSTTEHIIGTWIDGKPIYEKSYLYENSSGSPASAEIVIVNDFGTDKQCIPGGLQGMFYNQSSGANYQIPWADCNGSNENSTGLWIGDGKIKLRIRNDSYGNAYKLRITVRYTKTTD